MYDPSEVYFDSYSVNYTRRLRPFNSGRLRGAGESFPGDGRLRMICLPASARVARAYKQPSGSKDSNFCVEHQRAFFYERGGGVYLLPSREKALEAYPPCRVFASTTLYRKMSLWPTSTPQHFCGCQGPRKGEDTRRFYEAFVTTCMPSCT